MTDPSHQTDYLKTKKDGIVQLVEYWNHNPRVKGSIPFSVIFERVKFFKICSFKYFWMKWLSQQNSLPEIKNFIGDYSSVVEYLIVDQKVMGSIPINYP
jgi:hypothetical protein